MESEGGGREEWLTIWRITVGFGRSLDLLLLIKKIPAPKMESREHVARTVPVPAWDSRPMNTEPRHIEVTSNITLTLEGQSFQLTSTEAFRLRDALNEAIGCNGQPREEVNPEVIRNLIRLKGMRAVDLAKRLHTDATCIKACIASPNSGLKVGDKGWVKAA